MNQIEMFAGTPTVTDASIALKDNTDTSWIEVAMEMWESPIALSGYMHDLEDMVLQEQEIPIHYRNVWANHLISDLKDTIRVVKSRIQSITH